MTDLTLQLTKQSFCLLDLDITRNTEVNLFIDKNQCTSNK